MNRTDKRDYIRRLRKGGMDKAYAGLMAATESELLRFGVRTETATDLAARYIRSRWAFQKGHITLAEHRQQQLLWIATVGDRGPRVQLASAIRQAMNAEASRAEAA